MSLSRRDLDRRLKSLDEVRRDYFLKVVHQIDKDRRFAMRLTAAYLVLEGCCEIINIAIPETLFTEKLFSFLVEQGPQISRQIYSRDFIVERERVVYEVSVPFQAVIATSVLDAVRAGRIRPEEQRVFRFTSGSDQPLDGEFPYGEEE